MGDSESRFKSVYGKAVWPAGYAARDTGLGARPVSGNA